MATAGGGSLAHDRAAERERVLLDRAALTPPASIVDKLQTRGFIAGIAGLVLLIVGALVDIHQFWHSYLLGFVYVAAFPLGALGLLLLQHVTGGAWGVMIRRVLEGMVSTIPLLAILFIPVILGMTNIYEWTHEDVVRHSHVIQAKSGYLNTPFFIVRQVIYFAIWSFLAFRLTALSRRQDRAPEPAITRSLIRLSGPSILLYVVTVTFASFDWVMSLNAEWSSTIFGLLFIIGALVSAMAFTIMTISYFGGREPMGGLYLPSHFHDVGKLLFAFVFVWAYFSFSQFLITWSGNLPEEVRWYLARVRGGWQAVALLIILAHFALPFILLLSRDLKRNARTLAIVAFWLCVMRFVDMFWLIEPEFHRSQLYFHWMDVAAPLAFGGLVYAYFIYNVKKEALLPINEPELHEALHPVGHH